jgi:hypothetical protein
LQTLIGAHDLPRPFDGRGRQRPIADFLIQQRQSSQRADQRLRIRALQRLLALDLLHQTNDHSTAATCGSPLDINFELQH